MPTPDGKDRHVSRIAIVLADEFEDAEFTTPHTTLTEHGHELEVIGSSTSGDRAPDKQHVTGKHGTVVSIDRTIDEANPGRYDALIIPGGRSPQHLRADPAMVRLVSSLAKRGVPIAAVCHGASLLIEAGIVEGRTLTSTPSIQNELVDAGAIVVDEEVVIDGNLVTSRGPDDLPAFIKAIVAVLDDLDPDETDDRDTEHVVEREGIPIPPSPTMPDADVIDDDDLVERPAPIPASGDNPVFPESDKPLFGDTPESRS